MEKVILPAILGYGRLDYFLKIFEALKANGDRRIQLDASQLKDLSPAGYGMLACLFDATIEAGVDLKLIGLDRKFRGIPVIDHLLKISDFQKLPHPNIHDLDIKNVIVAGQQDTLNIQFIERFQEKFGDQLGEPLAFSCRLIQNELMQNCIDHSTSERYYLYGGIWNSRHKREAHIGVLDMGVTIPAKLQQKYDRPNDLEYLDLALKEGSTTRRIRPGGLGLYYTFEILKKSEGTLTILSRNAQLVRYFKNSVVRRRTLIHALYGTWCLARFPLMETKT